MNQIKKKKKKENKIYIFNKIKKNFNYLLFYKYSDITSNKLVEYKTILNTENIHFKCIKNTLNFEHNSKLKNQGPTLVFYFNNFSQINKLKNLFLQIKNLQFMYSICNNKLYTNYKISPLLQNKPVLFPLTNTLLILYLTILQLN